MTANEPPKTEAELSQQKRDADIQMLLQRERMKWQGLGAGLNKEVMYYGTNLYTRKGPLNVVITSEHKAFVKWEDDNDEIRNLFGLNYRFNWAGGRPY